MSNNLIIILIIASLGIIAFLGFLTIKQVPQGYEWTLERFGRLIRVLKPGLHFLIPFVDAVGYRVNMKEQVLDIPAQEVISADNAVVTVNGVVFFMVFDAAKSAYEVNQLDFAIMNLVITNLRNVLGNMELDQMLAQRGQINTNILRTLLPTAQAWGVKITRIEIKDIAPPADLIEAMAKQMKAEREKRAAILEAEGQKQSKILKAEGEKQSAILQSEGVRQATILQSEAKREAAFREAEGRERQAKAEAVATEMMSAVLERGGNIHALNYFIAQRYLESLSQLAQSNNQKIMMLPMESTQILGSLSGIKELLNAAEQK
jgi:regulator of protease activity HflC (stomatin/prohibitin superfamily)